MSWALACTQGQAELSTNIKLIVQSLYEGQWPYELASQLSKILPKHISFTNPKWWSNAGWAALIWIMRDAMLPH